MSEAKEKKTAKISLEKNQIVVSCPRHRELKKTDGKLLEDRCVLLEPGEAECKYCKVVYTWPEIDCQIFDPKE